MRSDGVVPPTSRPLLTWFLRYVDWFLRRNFHAVRLSRLAPVPPVDGSPHIVCMNHAGWWDPLIALKLAYTLYPGHAHYGPIEAKALSQYRIFEKFGFFGIDPGTPKGAARFLRTGEAILASPDRMLWMTPQGKFVDPRVRPTEIREGVGHLACRLKRVCVVPLAIEFPFWEERYPEALLRFGEPLKIDSPGDRAPGEWAAAIGKRLEEAQDALLRQACLRDTAGFDTLVSGNAGVGGVYDVGRSLKARLLRQRFKRAHGTEVS